MTVKELRALLDGLFDDEAVVVCTADKDSVECSIEFGTVHTFNGQDECYGWLSLHITDTVADLVEADREWNDGHT